MIHDHLVWENPEVGGKASDPYVNESQVLFDPNYVEDTALLTPFPEQVAHSIFRVYLDA